MTVFQDRLFLYPEIGLYAPTNGYLVGIYIFIYIYIYVCCVDVASRFVSQVQPSERAFLLVL